MNDTYDTTRFRYEYQSRIENTSKIISMKIMKTVAKKHHNLDKLSFNQTVESTKKLGRILRFAGNLQYLTIIKKASPAELGVFTRDNLADLGATFIKIGQLLSTRSDIFDVNFTRQLATLQDKVPPFDISMYLDTVTETFVEFDTTPIASASIGQVHKGTLKSGEEVAIKFKRPNIEQEVTTDFQMLLGLISILRSLFDKRELYELQTVFKQYQILINEEIDFNRELQNIQEFKKMFVGDAEKWIRIPTAYPAESTNDMIVMEYLPTIKINDIKTLDRLQFNKSKIAEKLVECYITQVVEFGKVHIDPHPGNVGVTPSGKIVFYDYGMVATISQTLRDKFQDLLVAITEKDSEGIARIMVESEIVTIEPDKMVYLKSFVLSFLNYIENVDVSYFKENFIDKINNNALPFLINSNFLLLLRGLTILEGVCKTLDPNFNYKKVIDPYIGAMIPIDIEYLEKRVLKDIESIQKMSLSRTIIDTQKNDVDKELLEKRLKDVTNARDKQQSRQLVSNLLMIGLLCAVGLGETLTNNWLVQLGIMSVTFLSVYNK